MPWPKGKKKSKKLRKRISNTLKGRVSPTKGMVVSEETKLKISKSLKGHKSWNKGKQLSEEYKQKISLALKGKKKPPRTKEHSKKIGSATSKRLKIKWKNPEFKKEMSKKISKSLKEVFKKKENHPCYGRKITEKHLEKLAEGRRKSEKCKYRSKEWSKKIALANKGKRGVKHSEKTKKQISKIMKLKWQDPEYKEKQIKAILKGLFKRPTSLEQKLINLIKKHKLPYKYAGDGSFTIGFKCPDFINTNHQKICIEVRSKEVCRVFGKSSPKKYKEKQIKHYAKYGWKCFVIWPENLKNKNWLEDLRGLETSEFFKSLHEIK